MRILYLDCRMGAAGDMLTAALLELLPEGERAAFVERMNALGIPGVHVELLPAVKCGITGSRVAVTVRGEDEEEHCHEHAHAHEHAHGHCHHHEHEPGHCEAHPGCPHGHAHAGAEHHHHSLADISAVISGLDLPESGQGRAAYTAAR